MDKAFAEATAAKLVPAGMVTTENGMVIKNEINQMAQGIANVAQAVMYGFSGPNGQNNIHETLKRSVVRRFVPYVNMYATSRPNLYHHMYEWNKVGRTEYRLFDPVISREGRRKASFNVSMIYRPSITKVPLTEAQTTPGPTGKVVKKRYTFKNKAMVMETGRSVIIRRKGKSMLAYGKKEITFSAGPITINYGKRATAGQFSKITADYFSRVAPGQTRAALELYSSEVAVRSAKAVVKLNVSVPSDTYAKAIGTSTAKTMRPVG